MTEKKKQEETNISNKETRQEIKYPQIASELRGEYTIYMSERKVFKWNFPYQSTFEDTIYALDFVKAQVKRIYRRKREV